MEFKRFIFIGLVLGVGLLGYSLAGQQRAQSLLERLRPPSADQVKKWKGFPESDHFTMFTNVPNDGGYDPKFGNFKWLWIYEDCKGSNYIRFFIAVYEPGGFWPAKRDELIKVSEQMHKMYLDLTNHIGEKWAKGNVEEIFFLDLSPMTTPNGQKSYGSLYGLSPLRLAIHPEFDVSAWVFSRPDNYYNASPPPADLPEIGTNPFTEFFTNVDAFLTSQ